jgi:predicted DCC family thiol-disulfide oxidoreductase YuxK
MNEVFTKPEVTALAVHTEQAMDSKLFPLEFLYDGSCPICRYDVVRLHKADRKGHIIFLDVTDPNFDPEIYGQTRQRLLERIHARRADGIIIDGPEVFRVALTALGYGWLVAPTRWPVLGQITDMTYNWFARNRGAMARLFGDFYTRRTPMCDLTCQSHTNTGDGHTPSTKSTDIYKAGQSPVKPETASDRDSSVTR